MSTGVASSGGTWSPSGSYQTKEEWNTRHLAARGVPPGDTCKNSSI